MDYADEPETFLEADAQLIISELFGFETLKNSATALRKEEVDNIANSLPLYDHIAFAFLAYRDPSTALGSIKCAIESFNKREHWQEIIVPTWINSQESCYRSFVIEILHLLNHWELLRKLKVNRHSVQYVHVDTFRLTLFMVIEKLSKVKMSQLVEIMDGQVSVVDYAEVKFLTWLEENKISLVNCGLLIASLTRIGLETDAKILSSRCQQLLAGQMTAPAEGNGERESIIVSPPSSMATVSQYQLQSYVMDPKRAGLCVIINQRNFRCNRMVSPKLSDRLGTDADCQNLNWTFKMFGFQVRIYENLTSKKLFSELEAISQENFENCDSFVLCILSHGIEGAVYGSDGLVIEVRDLALMFSTDRCPSLYQKPKLIFVQACQGSEGQVPFQPCLKDIQTDGAESRPPISDFFEAWATVPGYVSYRSTTQGSIFVRTLCRVLQTVGHEMFFEDVMKVVNNEVSKMDNRSSADVRRAFKQMPTYSSCLTRSLKFARHEELFYDAVIDRFQEIFFHLCLSEVINQYLKIPAKKTTFH